MIEFTSSLYKYMCGQIQIQNPQHVLIYYYYILKLQHQYKPLRNSSL